MTKIKHVEYQRVMKAVGRFPTVENDPVMGLVLPESVYSLQRLMTTLEGEVAAVMGIPGRGEACGESRAGGGVPARFAGTPRRTIGIHYPSQKGGHTFRVCRTAFRASSRSKSMCCDDVKLSDKGMSVQRCGDNCGDNCGDKKERNLLKMKLL